MPRYTDVDKLIEKANQDGAYGYVSAQEIDNQPTADVVEVVRCDQCRHFDAINNDDHGWCKLISDLPCEMSVRYDNDFCSFGERKEE